MARLEDPNVVRSNARIGSALMMSSLVGLILCLAARSDMLPGFMLRLWSQAPTFWSGLTLAAFFGGAYLLWNSSQAETDWRPAGGVRKFETAVLYTKQDCPLCDEALTLLKFYRRWLPPIRIIDINVHPDFRDVYGECVPVLEIDDIVRFRGRISEILLRRLLQGGATATDLEKTC